MSCKTYNILNETNTGLTGQLKYKIGGNNMKVFTNYKKRQQEKREKEIQESQQKWMLKSVAMLNNEQMKELALNIK
jgi:hypothetical protein